MINQNQETIYGRWQQIAQQRGQATALLGPQSDSSFSYQQLNDLIIKVAAGLTKLGFKSGDRLAICSANGPQWVIMDLACNYLGVITVPIHTTFAPPLISYILYDSGAKAVACSGHMVHKVLEAVNDNLSIILFDEVPVVRPLVVDWHHLLSLAKDTPPPLPRSASGLCTIIYTSGTTGDPKGVCLTDSNILNDIDGALALLPMYATDRWCSFLPLAHALERTGGLYTPLMVGAQIAFARSITTLADDLKHWQPTILISVPRIFERAYEKITAKASSSPITKLVFHWALKAAKGGGLAKKLAEALVLKKVRLALGGQLRLAISGGATLNPHIAKFFKRIGIMIIEGYGLTETSPIISVNPISDIRFGTVGKPLAGVNVTISSAKEILVSGPVVGLGYWSAEEVSQPSYIKATESDELTRHIRPFSDNGVLATGDLGYMDNDGYLTVIGRAKEIFVLPNGKKVNPVDIEQRLEVSDYIDQVFVYLDHHNKLISALLVPRRPALEKIAQLQGLTQLPEDMESLVNWANDSKPWQDILRGDIESRQNHLPEYEQVKHWQLTWPPFTEEREELTPTLKLRRSNIFKRLSANH